MSDAIVPVLDSFALLAWLQDEPGADQVDAALRNAVTLGVDLPLCVVNWAEALYVVRRELGEAGLEKLVAIVEQLPVRLVDADRDLALSAARLKAEHPVSLADAFCSATALAHGAPVLTGDPEFPSVEGVVDVAWVT